MNQLMDQLKDRRMRQKQVPSRCKGVWMDDGDDDDEYEYDDDDGDDDNDNGIDFLVCIYISINPHLTDVIR